jgi:uncharacterized protein (TIGR00730 family)
MDPSRGLGIAVFGSSEPVPGDALYEQAHTLGRLLAEAGHDVVTGGYGGVMEAAGRGAVEAGGRSVGVCCDIFPQRTPNRYLSEVVRTADLYDRTRELVQRARGFVVLAGKSGTLAELAFLWALHRAGCLDRRPVILLGGRFSRLVDHLASSQMLDAPQIAMTRLAADPDEAVEILDQMLATEDPRA